MVAYTAFGKVMRQCRTRVQRTGASLLGQFSSGTITDQTTAHTKLLRLTQAGLLAATPVDLDGDGQANAADRQVMFANYGWRANLAPALVAGADTALRTHADLSASRSAKLRCACVVASGATPGACSANSPINDERTPNTASESRSGSGSGSRKICVISAEYPVARMRKLNSWRRPVHFRPASGVALVGCPDPVRPIP